MQLLKQTLTHSARVASVLERVIVDTDGPWEDALVFAASSIVREIGRPDYDERAILREIRTERGVYTLKGHRIATPEGLRPVVSVSAEPVPPHMPPSMPDERLRDRFRLTRKEVRVARLLVQHKTNAQIADELCISPHTARHHTQSVLEKLGVRSRTAVAAVLGTDASN